ncbi:hypothetical protein FLP10_16145 [Agromyces intestinalis]|uniref:Peptidase S11 D-alanyl-D-alanine carboxypeptidase A N-terminal domain-containing protein n=1 Tax=Agromyces intestinalis TaxID=2592652 RepID=A0A5C1YKG4_9MICO|nr:hypothetical protein [Agromyces intestinalis]QEO15780.1 hypothetical protein FLP10_16145 [Agromyces intestinalis]
MSLSPGRIVGIIVGAVAILGIGVYGPAMLLGPLPAAAVSTAKATDVTPPAGAEIPLPADGQSAVAVVGADGEAAVVAQSGGDDAVPIGGAAKLVTLLVTLDSLPLPPDEDGPGVTIKPADYTDYLNYQKEDARTLQVSPGETWTERDVVRAVLFASSNNHADTLARWAFGSVEKYVTAANAWLDDHEFTATRVADATGLSGDNIGNATELTRLAAMAMASPSLGSLLDGSATLPSTARKVPDVVARLDDQGVRAITRSYTDPAALTFLFTTEVADEASDGSSRLVGAMLLIPDYETLDPAVAAVVEAASAAAAPIELITAGTSYGSVSTAWGDRADLVASTTRAGTGWTGATGKAKVTVEAFTTASSSRDIGRVSVPTGDGEVGSPLRLSADIDDPGPLWRLANPFAIIGAFAANQD